VTEFDNVADSGPGTAAEIATAEGFSAALLAVASDAMRLAQSLGCKPDQAADVVQEAASAAWRYRASCRTNFRAWFLTIVRRKTATRPRDWLTTPLFWREHAPRSQVPTNKYLAGVRPPPGEATGRLVAPLWAGSARC
jgi:DNA-directed RNA polymerase specialized sigma24 family protein